MKQRDKIFFLLFTPILTMCSGGSPTPTGAFLVTWKNYDGNILTEEKYNYGEMPSYKGSIPTKPDTKEHSYTFSSWSPTLEKVTCNKVYTATFNESLRKYSVNWYNGATCLETDEVEYGTVPTYKGPTPQKVSDHQYDYSFSGWSPNVVAVTGQANYYAQFSTTTRSYQIIWQDDEGKELKKETLPYGSMPSYSGTPTKQSTAQYDYKFSGWSPTVKTVTGSAIYKATFSTTIRSYEITWKNYNGDVLKTETLPYGSTPSYEGTPTKPSTDDYEYVFSGWSPTITSVTGPSTYIAQFTSYRKYLITWKDGDGNVLKTEKLRIGSTPKYVGPTPTKQQDAHYTYTFSGWSPTITPVTSSKTYTATFSTTTRSYEITWKNYNGDVLKKETLPYGSTPSYEGTPTKPSTDDYEYVFSGWSPTITSVTGPATYIAQFATYQKHLITFKNYDGAVLETKKVREGVVPTYTGTTPTKSSTDDYVHAFSGWSPNVTIVAGPATYIAQFNAHKINARMEVVFPITSSSLEVSFRQKYYEPNHPIVDWGDGTIDHSDSHSYQKFGSYLIKISDYKSVEFKLSTSEGLISEGNAYITKVVLPNTITSIDVYAFHSCTSLSSITIPNSVTSIGNYAFHSCTSLSSITIPNSVTSIGNYAFYYCIKLSSINIPSSVTSIGSAAFEKCKQLQSITFDSNSNLTSIGRHTFDSCEELSSITIPNSVTSIGGYAFYHCIKLSSINIPSGVASIAEGTFAFCNLISITIPKSVVKIEDSSVYPGGDGAFYHCSSLKIVNFENGSKLEKIGDEAFDGCSSLKSINIPNSVTSIGHSPFYGCHLTSIAIPKSVVSICNGAFSSCITLTSITVDSNNPKYDSRGGCNAIIETATNTLISGCKNTVIPNSVTSIGKNAFIDCKELSSITIPNSITSIGDDAFYGCSSLTSIFIPSSVTTMGSDVFNYCYKLTNIYCEAKSRPIGWDAYWLGNIKDITSIYWGVMPPKQNDII